MRALNKTQSLYLDIIRFLAALAVFFAHIPLFMGGYLWQFGQLGHQAVVVFFVLSGFVIAFVSDTKEVSLKVYAANRATRIYSVAIPAILIAIIAFYLAKEHRPEVISSFSTRVLEPYLTLLSALTFTNQAWINYTVFANPPFWSLSYEVLYYVLFGVVFYVKGIYKYLFSIFILIAMGPSILLYLPIWLLGVYCYYQNKKTPIFSPRKALYIFLSSALLFCFLTTEIATSTINHLSVILFPKEFFSILIPPANNFLIDYLLAISLTINIWSIRYIKTPLIAYVHACSSFIRKCSSYTFSLYLYHFPLLCLFAIVMPFTKSPLLAVLGCLVLTPLSIVLLSFITEQQRHKIRHIFKSGKCT